MKHNNTDWRYTVLPADNGLCITSYEGTEERVTVPSRIDGVPVRTIGKKAFLGNRSLCCAELPDTIETIGDWAFFGCRMLREVVIPQKEIHFGNHIFQKSEHLQAVSFAGCSPELATLLATAVTVLQAEYILCPLQAGNDNWYRRLDARILTFLQESEESALKDLVYCAEEDMGEKREACLRQQAHRKAELAFLRLVCPEGMEPVMYKRLADYLRERTKGCKEETAWETVKESRLHKLQYGRKLYEIGGIHEGNFHALLEELGDDEVELKAYLLKEWKDRQASEDLWGALQFDWERVED